MFVVGIIAVILGLTAASFSITVHSTVPDHIVVYSNSLFYESGELTLLFAIIGLIGVVLMNQRRKLAGLLMIIAGIGGFIFLTYSFFPSTVLFFIAGIHRLVTKPIRS